MQEHQIHQLEFVPLFPEAMASKKIFILTTEEEQPQDGHGCIVEASPHLGHVALASERLPKSSSVQQKKHPHEMCLEEIPKLDTSQEHWLDFFGSWIIIDHL